MNAYLMHLGIRPEIQEWLAPHYYINEAGHLCFPYSHETEVFSLGFHRVPLNGHWQTDNHLIRQTIICSSAMEGIAWLNCHSVNLDHLQIIAGNLPRLPKGKYVLVFGNDLTGHLYDLKTAAILTGHPIAISYQNDTLKINFRYKQFEMPAETFTLNAFERLSGFRFHVKTSKPTIHSTWLDQLINHGNY